MMTKLRRKARGRKECSFPLRKNKDRKKTRGGRSKTVRWHGKHGIEPGREPEDKEERITN